MAEYDSDSSHGDDIETNVLLGYATKEPTGDPFSQLGGHPIWLDETHTPSAALAKCRVCNGLMNLLLQLNGDLPDRFPGHERRLYLWTCRRKACRRKEGSVRGFRATRQTPVSGSAMDAAAFKEESTPPAKKPPVVNLGETLFGVKSSSNAPENPFGAPNSNGAAPSNPFASASTLAAKQPQKPTPSLDAPTEPLAQTFAEKARFAAESSSPPQPLPPQEPWPAISAFPAPYPAYFIDADKEYIDVSPPEAPSTVRVDNSEATSSSGAGDAKDAFESSMDKIFQKFADRLSQNPEQILRYEYHGQPLLYSKKDAVGKMLDGARADGKVTTSGTGKIPRCSDCGSERVFELQLTPHAIAELEAEEMGLDGMDWGTILLGTCARDCQEKGIKEGGVGFVEEWVGVQWEELGGK